MDASEREQAASAARDEAVRVLAGTAVNLAVLIGLSLAIEHHAVITARGKQLLARFRRRGPADAELQVADFNATVSAYSHGGGSQ